MIEHKDLKPSRETASLYQFSQLIKDALDNGTKLTEGEIKKICSKCGIDYGSNIGKVKETIEITLMHIARSYASLSPSVAYQKIRDLYQKQPTVGKMNLRQMALQQYSTSLPVAYLMSRYVREHTYSLYFEPSAGNGFLTIALPPGDTIVNEIDTLRLENLRKENFREVISQDGREVFKFYQIFGGVVMNPPFLKKGETDKMIFNALTGMLNRGRAAILRDGWNSFEDYYGTKQRNKFQTFYDELFAEYNVVKIINLKSTDVYSKQGTVTPMQIILIDGRRREKERKSIYRVFNPNIDILEPQGFDGLWAIFSQYFGESQSLQNTEMKLLSK